MGWSSAFLALLGSRHYRPTWLLEVVRTPVAGESDVWASHPSLGPDALAGLPRVSGSSISPISWSPVYGSWSVTAQGDGARAIATLPRGALVRLLAGFASLTRSDMEPVALGVVKAVRGGPQGVTVECWDLISALTSRWTQTLGRNDLFWGLVSGETMVNAEYYPGGSTLSLTSASGMAYEAGGTGAVQVVPATGYDPFFLTFTGISTNNLTGCSSTGQFGTTAATAPVGSVARPVAYLYGHPCDIIKKILLSGSGTTDWDLLPESWGFAMPEDLVDLDDIADWQDRIKVSSGSYSWDVTSLTSQPTGMQWLQTYLSRAGIWLASRQGRITVRSVIDTSVNRDLEDAISEDDLAGSWSWEWPDSSFAKEYREVSVESATTSYEIHGSSLETMPTQNRVTYDLGDVVFSNETAIVTETCHRLAPWATKLPEVVTLPCRGWRLAGLCPGDPVRLDLPRMTGPLTARSGSYNGWPATVVSVSPDFSRHQTTIRVWPDREST